MSQSSEQFNPNSYKCVECRDTGWLIEYRADSQPYARRCKCYEIERVTNQWKKAGINPEVSNQTFNSFEIWNSSSKKAKDTATAYYKAYDSIKRERKNSILFCGQVGSGKTHLSIALALNFLKKKYAVVYMPYRDIITNIKQNMLDEEFYKKTISKYQTAEVLLMDDLFKGKINDSDINIMFEIINYRYLNHLPMIVSTEFPVEELLNFDEAVGSRIYEMSKNYIVEIEKKKENNYRLK